VESMPHTLVLAVRFRCANAGLSAQVANSLVEAYRRQEMYARIESTRSGTDWLNAQLSELKDRVARDDSRLAEFQKEHGILGSTEGAGEGRLAAAGHGSALTAVDGLSREMVIATSDRILREAEFRAAAAGNPERVLVSDGRSDSTGNLETMLLQQLHARRSELEQERAQLEIEHGPNFPRVVEIRRQMQDVDMQVKDADAKLMDRYRSAWKMSVDREQLLRKSLDEAMGAGLNQSGAMLQYASMWQEANANRELYVRLMQQAEEAGLAAGSHGSAMSVIDYAREPVKPVSPNLPVNMALSAFVAFWVALGAVLGRETFRDRRLLSASLIGFVALSVSVSGAQAPTPSTSGLPTGVARIPQSVEMKSVPNAKSAPVVWISGEAGDRATVQAGTSQSSQAMAGPIGAGDMLEVTEEHSREMRASVRVSDAGTVTLPLAGEVNVGGMDERSAARAIERALTERGMLLHPHVTVLVTAYAGQDVSVLGEVGRPGVYSYTMHHRLLDLISAASGLSQNAGRLVTITHRADPERAVAVELDLMGRSPGAGHNPELLPGDTVQVNRAGLVYVVGDVIRPGGFPVDPAQRTTVVQMLSLAWGPAQNAALKKAVLIREQEGGRTVTTLNLKRMLRGLDPDLPVRDRDILFVPDSMAKNLLNRSMESVIQSAAGVSIYSGLVYSQRF
jgi:polysaccharide biosynthesis/export protein